MNQFLKDAKSPLPKLLDVWRKDQIEQIGVLRNIPTHEIENLTLRLYHAIACADGDDCEREAINTPKECYNRLVELSDCNGQSAYKHYTAMICEIIMLCLQLSGSIKESHAIGFLSYALKGYPDVKTSMWDLVNQLGLNLFQAWVERGCLTSGQVEKTIHGQDIPSFMKTTDGALPQNILERIYAIENQNKTKTAFVRELLSIEENLGNSTWISLSIYANDDQRAEALNPFLKKFKLRGNDFANARRKIPKYIKST